MAETKAQTVKVKIEATELDKAMLLDKLNHHGADHGLKFEVAEKNYNYRIAFATGQRRASVGEILLEGGLAGVNRSLAQASVFDAQDHELFHFTRDIRLTDKGATNAVAKEIIKRLIRWWHTPEGKQAPGSLPR